MLKTLPRVTARALVVAAIAAPLSAVADPVVESTLGWMINGVVSEVARAGDVAYVGGSFHTVAPRANLVFHNATFSLTSAVPVLPRLDLNGALRAVAAVPGGGWMIGGEFTQVDGLARGRLARLAADGSVVSTFAISANARVRSIAVAGNIAYVGGDFSMIGGAARARLAAIDLTTGAVVPGFAPLITGAGVYDIAPGGATIYVGGDFSQVDGIARPFLAAVNAATGSPHAAFDAQADGPVVKVLKIGSQVVAAGDFQSLGGLTRRGLAKVDETTGAGIAAFNANMATGVSALAGGPAALYVGGSFSSAGGASRQNLAALDVTTGAANAWNPGATGAVAGLGLLGTTLVAAGSFESVGGIERLYVAAFDTASASNPVRTWNPALNEDAGFVAVDAAGYVFVGGSFTAFGAVRRDNLAAIDLRNGELLPWNPGTNGWVRALDVHGTTVFIGGDFTSIAGVSRGRIAAIDALSGAASGWNPNANGPVKSMMVSADTVYFVGQFTSIGSGGAAASRGRGAAVAVDGTVRPWNPAANATIETLFVDAAATYVGGSFQTLGGQPRVRLGAVDSITGVPLSGFTPSVNDTIYRLDVQDGRVYFGGIFQSVNGTSRNRAAAVQGASGGAAAGTLLGWNPDVGGPIYDLDVTGADVYLAGGFGSVDGSSRPGMAIVAADPGSPALRAWKPTDVSGGSISVIDTSAEAVLFGGALYDLNGFDIGAVLYPQAALAGAPRSPVTPDVFIDAATVTLTWARPPLGAAPAGYVIEAGTGPGRTDLASFSTGSTDTRFAASGLPAGTYFLRLRASNAYGTSAPSDEQAFTIGSATCASPPERPLDVVAAASGTDVTIQWRSAPQSIVTGYLLHVGTASGLANVGTIALGPVTSMTAMAPPGAFFLTLSAVNDCGSSPRSAETVLAVGGAPIPPTPPFALEGTVAGSSVSLAWAAPPIGSGPFTYVLEVGSAPGLSNLGQLPTPTASFAASGVPPGIYYVRVRAIGLAGVSPPGNEIVLVVP